MTNSKTKVRSRNSSNSNFERRTSNLPFSILVTGGAGFIGSNFIHYLFNNKEFPGKVVNYDNLTYAGNEDNLREIKDKWNEKRYFFIKGDIGDRRLVKETLARFKPQAIINFAAESHVDRSIDSPMVFIDTNIKGTALLLEEVLHYWEFLEGIEKEQFRFFCISLLTRFLEHWEKPDYSKKQPPIIRVPLILLQKRLLITW